jgi:hypothetical protein
MGRMRDKAGTANARSGLSEPKPPGLGMVSSSKQRSRRRAKTVTTQLPLRSASGAHRLRKVTFDPRTAISQMNRAAWPEKGWAFEMSRCLHTLAPALAPEIVERKPGVGGYSVAKVRNASSVGSQKIHLSDPETWVTECTYDIGYTFSPKGLSRGCEVFSSRSR